MDISYVCLVLYNGVDDNQVYELPLKNDVIETIENSLKEPSTFGMKRYSDISETLDSPNKYSVSDTDAQYQTEILTILMEKIESDEIELLKTWEEGFSVDNADYNKFIAYYNETNEKGVYSNSAYIYPLNDRMVVENRVAILKINRKFNVTDADELYIKPIEGRIDLPTDKKKCVVSFHKRFQENHESTKVNVYNAFEFDDLFKTPDTQEKYVENTLSKFSDIHNPTLLTDDNIKVQINENDEEIKDLIYSDKHLTKTFASFTGSSRNTIQKTKLDKVEDVLQKLRNYADRNADCKFTTNNVPQIIEVDGGKVLQINVDSAPIFAALLENKIIQRLLNDKIQIPYYNRQ